MFQHIASKAIVRNLDNIRECGRKIIKLLLAKPRLLRQGYARI